MHFWIFLHSVLTEVDLHFSLQLGAAQNAWLKLLQWAVFLDLDEASAENVFETSIIQNATKNKSNIGDIFFFFFTEKANLQINPLVIYLLSTNPKTPESVFAELLEVFLVESHAIFHHFLAMALHQQQI